MAKRYQIDQRDETNWSSSTLISCFKSVLEECWNTVLSQYKLEERYYEQKQAPIANIVVHDLLDFTSQGRERLHKAISISSIRHMTRGNLLYIPLTKTLICTAKIRINGTVAVLRKSKHPHFIFHVLIYLFYIAISAKGIYNRLPLVICLILDIDMAYEAFLCLGR